MINMNCPNCGTQATKGELENGITIRMKCQFCKTEFTDFTLDNQWRGRSDKYLDEMRRKGIPENIVEAFSHCKNITLRKQLLEGIKL